jgi:hypothetical protein
VGDYTEYTPKYVEDQNTALDLGVATNPTTYSIVVVTGVLGVIEGNEEAHTHANGYITLNGTKGKSNVIMLDNQKFQSDWGEGRIDVFNFDMEDLGDLQSIIIGHDNGKPSRTDPAPGWFIEKVTILNGNTGQEWVFPCHKWFALDFGDHKIERVLNAL